MHKILVTGFEPFGGSEINPSAEIAARLAAAGEEGVELATAVLPVDRERGPDTLIRALIAAQPDTVLCLGEAGGRAIMTVERVGINLLDFELPDNSGAQPRETAVNPDGPTAYFATLPVRRLVNALQTAGIPAAESLSAGTYLCNQVLYTVLHYVARHKLPIRAGFIHLPQLPQQVAARRENKPSMPLTLQEAGVRVLVRELGGGS